MQVYEKTRAGILIYLMAIKTEEKIKKKQSFSSFFPSEIIIYAFYGK